MADQGMTVEEMMSGTPEDQTLQCRDCGDLYLFTVAEQEHYLKKGLKHPPSRCPSCRKKNRAVVQSTMVPVQCRRCKRKGFVPEAFPQAIDVLCESCFSEIKQRYLPAQPEPVLPQAQPDELVSQGPAAGSDGVSDGSLSTATNPPLISGDLVEPSASSGGASVVG